MVMNPNYQRDLWDSPEKYIMLVRASGERNYKILNGVFKPSEENDLDAEGWVKTANIELYSKDHAEELQKILRNKGMETKLYEVKSKEMGDILQQCEMELSEKLIPQGIGFFGLSTPKNR